ncbi:MAG TPA: type II secretory pathway, component PulD [Opitutae bacterium]|nr:type II secretory pathway, component PulD [Opitutae bacterium]
MKKYLAARLRISAFLMAAALGSHHAFVPQMATAQSAPQKIQLMADTLRAHDSGNLGLAKKHADELVKVAPDDANVQRLVARIDKSIEVQNSEVSNAVAAQVSVDANSTVAPIQLEPAAAEAVDEPVVVNQSNADVKTATAYSRTKSISARRGSNNRPEKKQAADADAEAIVEAVVSDQKQLIAAAEVAIDEAQILAAHDAYVQANQVLDAASASLTLNVSTSKVLESIESTKLDIVLLKAQSLAKEGNIVGARQFLDAYRAAGGSSRAAKNLTKKLDKQVAAVVAEQQKKASAAAAAIAEQEQLKAAAAIAEQEQRAEAAAIAEQKQQAAAAAAVIAEQAKKTAAADSIVAAAAADQAKQITAAENAVKEANMLAELGAYAKANGMLNLASTSLTLNASTAKVLEAIESTKTDIMLMEAQALSKAGNAVAARQLLEEYLAAGALSRGAKKLTKKLDTEAADPYARVIEEISPEFVAQNVIIEDLLVRGRAQFLNGDFDGASATFKEVEAREANNPEAKLFQARIAEILRGIHKQNLYKTRNRMLAEVDQGWERPKVFNIDAGDEEVGIIDSGILQKMKAIVVPQVNFSGMELTRVIDTLSELSVEYDPEKVGVNIVPLFDANESNPRVNISLRNLNLDRILEFVTQQVNFAYTVGADAVTVDASDATGGESSNVTEFFPISRATIIRLTGFRDDSGGSSAAVDPFAAPSSGGGGAPANDETTALKRFFQSAGVNFELPGASLAFDGEQLIVTQTSRNLERMRVILRNYNEVKQVEIEAKFLEVTQGDLDELGFKWGVEHGATALFDATGIPIVDDEGRQKYSYSRNFDTGNRSLNDSFGTGLSQSAITVGGNVVAVNAPPSLTTTIDLAASAASLFTSSGWNVAGASVDVALRALSRKAGSDLMSAPKVTVLSGKEATIKVAQQLRYPESYGDIQSEAGGGGSSSSSSSSSAASISITAGTPQDFVTKDIGVEMRVTPNVESDDTISLRLEPKVTEFEGFVEYGGPSVAISGDLSVTVPAGFYQPIFSTREIITEVTVFDGATVVMGGLTRDEVKTVSDKVPILGDIPFIGRLFRSEGETRDKRNLLIFVTANLVSPGGSPARQSYRNVKANSLFQNPTIMTPSGSVNRSIEAPTVE